MEIHALQAFEARFGNDPLVMDKWFVVQAMQPGNEALDKVRELMTHKLFSLDNPNRTRALIGAFSSGNQTGFNRADGAGYKFFAETILTIDKKNPQLAARLLTAMRSWRSFEPCDANMHVNRWRPSLRDGTFGRRAGYCRADASLRGRPEVIHCPVYSSSPGIAEGYLSDFKEL